MALCPSACSEVKSMWSLTCATGAFIMHHEQIIKKNLQDESKNLNRAQRAIEQLSTVIDPSTAKWIVTNSRLPEVRDDRP